jgi:elongation of very long chain fatty acids protein 7
VICIVHCIRVLFTDCEFPWIITALLLLNASIFFVLFMNFYIQNYKKQKQMLLLKKAAANKLS